MEFAYWAAMERISPGEPYRSDVRFAMIGQLIASAASSKGQKFTFEDFMPFAQKKKRDPKEVWTKLIAWGHAHNANQMKRK